MQYNRKNHTSYPPEKEVHKTTMYEAGSTSGLCCRWWGTSTAKQILQELTCTVYQRLDMISIDSLLEKGTAEIYCVNTCCVYLWTWNSFLLCQFYEATVLPSCKYCFQRKNSTQVLSKSFKLFRLLNFIYRRFGTHSPFHLHRRCKYELPTCTTYKDGSDRVFRNVGIENSNVRESPKRKNATFRTRRKFEIKCFSGNCKQCQGYLFLRFLFVCRCFEVYHIREFSCIFLAFFTNIGKKIPVRSNIFAINFKFLIYCW
jgi:hypothetical protein